MGTFLIWRSSRVVRQQLNQIKNAPNFSRPTIIQAERDCWPALRQLLYLDWRSAEGHRTLSERGIIAANRGPSTVYLPICDPRYKPL